MLPFTNKTFSINIQGCRTNQYEGEAIAAALEKAGAVHNDVSPDIAVIMTCTITAAADRKCRKLIRKLRRENPAAVIVVCGCYAQKISGAERELLDIDIVIGNRMKHKLPELLSQWYANEGIKKDISLFDDNILAESSWDGLMLDHPRMHRRAFLKVQDGCNHYCSYCIVPYVRGNPVSRDMDKAVAEARGIIDSGCKEIVLTGIHLGLYKDLGTLVRRIGNIDGLKRLRFGSIEPFAVDDALLDALAETETFCPHLHLPLQCGDDGVLAAMRRGYTVRAFRKITEDIRRRLGDKIHLSTDLMVGFPAEGDAAFDNSMKFIEEIGFGKVHVFPYSPREGTDAAAMERQPEKEVQERVHRALALADKLHKKYCSEWIGEKVSVLVEEKKNGTIRGLTPNYVRIVAEDNGARLSEEVMVTPQRYANGILLAGNIPDPLHDEEEFPEIL
ncbi:MAG: tRNA (N(6)-L-threonylcarbamoyladenosine(37)-C(2))-methylthiotransferase MtaB [Synergistaceae bacterium]|nr:tRNA (N(6)-L-threonylcarbamoyladenosine(37)-C(2))-methylthiotransferase MtaB [Synergistaceae bacterium]